MRKEFLLALVPDRRYAIPARAALDSMTRRRCRCMSSRTEHCLDIVGRSIVYHCAAAALVVSAIVTVWGLSCLYSLLLLLESPLTTATSLRCCCLYY
jgi:hypothetical protein